MRYKDHRLSIALYSNAGGGYTYLRDTFQVIGAFPFTLEIVIIIAGKILTVFITAFFITTLIAQ